MLTVGQVAEQLQVHKMTVYRWISEKRLKAYKISRNVVRVYQKDLDKFLQERKVKC